MCSNCASERIAYLLGVLDMLDGEYRVNLRQNAASKVAGLACSWRVTRWTDLMIQ